MVLTKNLDISAIKLRFLNLQTIKPAIDIVIGKSIN